MVRSTRDVRVQVNLKSQFGVSSAYVNCAKVHDTHLKLGLQSLDYAALLVFEQHTSRISRVRALLLLDLDLEAPDLVLQLLDVVLLSYTARCEKLAGDVVNKLHAMCKKATSQYPCKLLLVNEITIAYFSVSENKFNSSSQFGLYVSVCTCTCSLPPQH